MAPSKHTAAVIAEGGGVVELKQIDVPKPGDNEVLVRVIAAALNPTDCEPDYFFCLTFLALHSWIGKSAKPANKAGNVSGCDFAGVVEELGHGAEATRKVGERVTTFVAGGASGLAHSSQASLNAIGPLLSS